MGDGDAGTYGFTVGSSEFVISSAPRTKLAEFGQKDGGVFQGGFRSILNLKINGHVVGTSWIDLKAKADAIAKLLDPINGDKSILLDERNDREFTGRLVSSILPPVVGCSAFNMPLTFAVDPVATSPTTTTQTVALSTNPQTFTVPAAGVVPGNKRALPVWTIKNTNASALSSTILNNATTIQTMANSKSVAQNQYLRYDTERQITEFSTDGTAYTAAMSTTDGNHKWFPELLHGVSNSLTIYNVPTGVLTITYKTRY